MQNLVSAFSWYERCLLPFLVYALSSAMGTEEREAQASAGQGTQTDDLMTAFLGGVAALRDEGI